MYQDLRCLREEGESYPEDHGPLNTAFDWRHMHRAIFQNAAKRIRLRDVASRRLNLDTLGAELFQKILCWS